MSPGQTISLFWRWTGTPCPGQNLIQFCHTDYPGCTTIGTVLYPTQSFQWTISPIGHMGQLRLMHRVVQLGTCVDREVRTSLFTIVCQPLSISQNPQSVLVVAGSSAQFSAIASGTPNSYQWMLNGIPIPGAIRPSYIISSAQPSDSGVYTVQIRDRCQAFVTSSGATLRVCPPIEVQNFTPLIQAEVGRPFILSVSATGLDIQFTWFKEEQIIAHDNIVNFQNFTSQDYGQYSVELQDACGKQTVLRIILSSKPFAIIENPPSHVYLFVGESTRLEVLVLSKFREVII